MRDAITLGGISVRKDEIVSIGLYNWYYIVTMIDGRTIRLDEHDSGYNSISLIYDMARVNETEEENISKSWIMLDRTVVRKSLISHIEYNDAYKYYTVKMINNETYVLTKSHRGTIWLARKLTHLDTTSS